MMSYGMVVGYGRADDWGNVLYGLTMLFVIGGLYGFLGGGLFGLAISKGEKDLLGWPQVIIEMVVGGAILYFFLIEQFGWYMTPPRSEVWAICLGMALALAWIFLRLKLHSALRVAAFAGLGGGFGFAFGLRRPGFGLWDIDERMGCGKRGRAQKTSLSHFHALANHSFCDVATKFRVGAYPRNVCEINPNRRPECLCLGSMGLFRSYRLRCHLLDSAHFEPATAEYLCYDLDLLF
jgi:hypothetical protein